MGRKDRKVGVTLIESWNVDIILWSTSVHENSHGLYPWISLIKKYFITKNYEYIFQICYSDVNYP